MRKKEHPKIDFVITWVDGSDPEWQKEKSRYDISAGDKRNNRFRDWGLLKYWFRAVEQYAPWVNKIHFVTWGHIPDWLDTSNPKLHIVKHEDFIPHEFLPTFNSVVIELFLHKIPGLSENFVYFNDDMFLNAPVKPSYFFKNGLPCDAAILSAITPSEGGDHFSHCLLSDAELLEKDYDIRGAIKSNIWKWINIKYGVEQVRTLLLLPWRNFTGFRMHHMPISYKKTTFKTIHDRHAAELRDAASDKFRNNYKINHWVFRYEQLLSGSFSPRSSRNNAFCIINDERSIDDTICSIGDKKTKMLCINDNASDKITDLAKKEIMKAFDKKMRRASEYEK